MFKWKILLIALFFVQAPVFADLADLSTDQKLTDLNHEIQLQGDKLEDVYLIQGKLKKELTALNREMASLKEEEAKLKSELDKLFKEWQTTNERIAELDNQINSVRERSFDRLKAFYIAQNNNHRGYFVKVSAIDRLPTIAFLLSKVHRYDRGLVAEFSRLYQEQKKEEERYERTIKEQKIIKSKIIAKVEELNIRIKKKKSIDDLLTTKQKETERLLTQLRAHALRLETVVASITEGDDNSDKTPLRNEELSVNQQSQDFQKEFLGVGLKKSRGTLRRPVNGKVVRRFGKFRHSEFKDFVFSKGVLFSTAVGTPITAIAQGKVIYFGRLPGYGNMVILDHGKRSYSLYARLDNTSEKLSGIIAEGDKIGFSSQPGDDIGNFYFEIRINGKPVNPEIYYGKL